MPSARLAPFMLGCAVALTIACATSSKPSVDEDGISDELRKQVCAANEAIDAGSKIWLARDKDGKITRLSVTPSSNIADMGNLIFDSSGKLLGHDTGGEFPWDDEALLAKEQARVDALMAGATITEDQTPISCS